MFLSFAKLDNNDGDDILIIFKRIVESLESTLKQINHISSSRSLTGPNIYAID